MAKAKQEKEAEEKIVDENKQDFDSGDDTEDSDLGDVDEMDVDDVADITQDAGDDDDDENEKTANKKHIAQVGLDNAHNKQLFTNTLKSVLEHPLPTGIQQNQSFVLIEASGANKRRQHVIAKESKEMRDATVKKVEKKMLLEQGWAIPKKDTIEREELRKRTARAGVVKLFNTVVQSQRGSKTPSSTSTVEGKTNTTVADVENDPAYAILKEYNFDF